MRARRPFVFLLIAIVATDCACHPAQPVALADPSRSVVTGAVATPGWPACFARSRPGAPAATPILATQVPAASVMVAEAPRVVPLAVGGPDAPYTLDSGDKLRIAVFGQEGISNSYAVDAGGSVTLPLIGAVPARALTTRQLSSAIAERLRQGYIREPHVAVEIESYRPFFILGEVTAPGQYPYVPNMTAETAVAIAGGFTPRAFHKAVKISRPVDGQTLRISAPLAAPVLPGDTLAVDERWF